MLTIATILFAVTLAVYLVLMTVGMIRRHRPSLRIVALLAVLNLCSQIFLLVNGKTTCTIIYLASETLLFTLAGLTYKMFCSIFRRIIERHRENTEEKYEPEDKDEEQPYIIANPVGLEETIDICLNPEQYRIAFRNKVDELMEEGAFDNKEDAEAYVRQNPITLELYYEKGIGLFAVESETVAAEAACSPYTHRPIVEDDY